jgi:hypothetical protein
VDYKEINTVNKLFLFAMLAEKELQGRQHRPRTTFGASSTSRTHTPSSSHTPSTTTASTRPPSTPSAHVGKLPLQVPAKKQNLPAPATPSSGHSSGIVCHRCHGIGHVKKDCPSQRTYIATDEGYISASDGDGNDMTPVMLLLMMMPCLVLMLRRTFEASWCIVFLVLSLNHQRSSNAIICSRLSSPSRIGVHVLLLMVEAAIIW